MNDNVVVSVGGDEISLSVSGGDGAHTVILCVHGGPGGDRNGPGGLFVELAERLPALGIAVARFSLRGSGDTELSGGLPTLATGMDDVVACERAIRQQFPAADVVPVVESMGVTIAVPAIERFERAPSKIALLWPALNLFDTDLRDILTRENLAEAARTGSLRPWGPDEPELGYDFLRECLAVDIGSSLASLSAESLLVHGTADTEVPFAHAARAELILRESSCIFVPVEGGDHGLMRANERAIVVESLTNFLRR